MTRYIKLFRTALAVALASIFSVSTFVQADLPSVNPSLPPVHSQGQTEFLTGGIGKDESEAILKEGSSWPLMIELAQAAAPRAVYITDAQISIKDASGGTVLDINAAGPYVLVKLPPGKYSLDATYESKTLHRDLNIQKGDHKKMTLLWPEG